MIKLKNLKKNGSLIECDIIPEDSKESGHIVVNMDSKEIKAFILPKGYEWCISHLHHAKRKLIELSKDDELSQEYLVMWY